MRPDSRSVSFTFHKDVNSIKTSPQAMRSCKNFKQRLQDRFEKEKSNQSLKTKLPKDSNERGWNNLSFGSVSADSRRVLRSGAERISKTISSVRTTFGSISQV